MDRDIFNEIENNLDIYIREDHPHPDMKIFAGENGYSPADVAEVIRSSPYLELSEAQKELLLNSFIKKETEAPETAPEENYREWTGRRRKEIRKDFLASGLTVQEWLEGHTDVSEQFLRNIIDPSIWKERYQYVPRKDWKEILRVFLEDVPNLSVQQFCTEQGLEIKAFRKVVPPEVWEARFERKKRVIDWDSEIEGMKSSGLCLQDWAYAHGLSPTIFRKKCGEEIARLYDRDGRRAAMFIPEKSLKENAETLGLTCNGLSAWINSKLKELDPVKFRAFKMDDKDIKIVDLESKIRQLEETLNEKTLEIEKLKGLLSAKNSQICQMQTSTAQAKAKGETLAKQLREALKAFGA